MCGAGMEGVLRLWLGGSRVEDCEGAEWGAGLDSGKLLCSATGGGAVVFWRWGTCDGRELQ